MPTEASPRLDVDRPLSARPEDTAPAGPRPPSGARARDLAALRRHEGPVVLCLAAGLVLFRTAAFMFFDGAFNSDQAIVGLMATHLSEGRTFPVFVYGLDYLLAVEAWMAAPLFWWLGPSVFLLKLPLLLINLVLAPLLVWLLRREIGLGPWTALLVSSPFLLAPPGTTVQLVNASGGNIEPLLLVPLLWVLRRHPLSFGAVLALGLLQRVFVAYALGALVLVELADGTLRARAALRRYLRSAIAFTAVWQTVGLVQARAASGRGPSSPGAGVGLTGVPSGPTALNVSEALERFCWDPDLLPQRLVSLAGEHLGTMFGGGRVPLADLAVAGSGVQGVTGLWLLLGGMLALILGRLVWLGVRHGGWPWHDRPRFGLYLGLTGVLACGALALSRCGPLDVLTLRYTLHAVLAVTGLVGGYLVIEPRTAPRRLVLVVLGLWSLAAVWGHGRLLAELLRDPPQDQQRLLADYLVAHDVRYGHADYWDAYSTVFYANEQVILASTTVEFIWEYEWLALHHENEAVWIARAPCEGGHRATDIHYLCPPPPGR